MIISGGENIYPVEVEEVLNLHPGVADCIVTAAPDVKRGEIVTAYIIPVRPVSDGTAAGALLQGESAARQL